MTEVIRLTTGEWEEQYPSTIYPDTYETYGEDLEFVKSQNPNTIWTEVDGDDGGVYITNGMAYVNRVAYFITDKPFDPETHIEVCLLSPEEAEDA